MLLSDISEGSVKEILLKNQEPLELKIISYILMTLMFDTGEIL